MFPTFKGGMVLKITMANGWSGKDSLLWGSGYNFNILLVRAKIMRYLDILVLNW